MRSGLALVLAGILLAGCFGSSRGQGPARHILPRCDPEAYTQEEVNRIARGRAVDPAWREIREAYASGRMSDEQYAVLQGRFHAAGMSSIRAREMVQEMETARAGAKDQAGMDKGTSGK